MKIPAIQIQKRIVQRQEVAARRLRTDEQRHLHLALQEVAHKRPARHPRAAADQNVAHQPS